MHRRRYFGSKISAAYGLPLSAVTLDKMTKTIIVSLNSCTLHYAISFKILKFLMELYKLVMVYFALISKLGTTSFKRYVKWKL